MSVTRQDTNTSVKGAQSVGQSPKRNSGLFSFFKWFRASPAEELGEAEDQQPQEDAPQVPQVRPDLLNTSSSSSTDSLSSTGTVASFAFVPPSAYRPYGVAHPPEKCIVPGPITDTYRARLHQRDQRRESDKDLTLRKKYNLFFNRDTLRKSASSANCTSATPAVVVREPAEEDAVAPEDSCKSLPLMTRRTMQSDAEDGEELLRGAKNHRRANSESSKLRKSGAFCHVKGKRRAPQPPGGAASKSVVVVESGTMSLRRKKRLAPQPPAVAIAAATSRILNRYGTIEYADADDVLYNDSLKLDNGFLRPVKETEEAHARKEGTGGSSARASALMDAAPVSPRPWYKRTLGSSSNRDSGSSWKANIPVKNTTNKYHNDDYEPIDTLPEVGFARSSKHELNFLDNDKAKTPKKVEEKRKSGLSFLTNISELDREAAEIVKHGKGGGDADAFLEEDDTDLPPFMRPKAEHMRINSDSWISPKRRSARDLIAKFNAITNVTKVTVNSAFFSSASSKEPQRDAAQAKRDYFNKKCHATSANETAMEQKAKAVSRYFEPAKKAVVNPDKQKSEPPTTPGTPKLDRKSWYCPKCSVENDYWRIICHVCSTIKPYFDDLSAPPVAKNNSLEKATKRAATENNAPGASNVSAAVPGDKLKTATDEELFERVLQRSKTQIGFPTKSNVFDGAKRKPEKSAAEDKSKKEEREKLKKMLIEMKNSLPKRRLSNGKPANAANRASVIQEHPQAVPAQAPEPPAPERSAEITVVTTETIYENVRMRRTENPKPLKVSSAAQTNAAVFKPIPNLGIAGVPPGGAGAPSKNGAKTFELIRAKDFLGMSVDDKTHIYANLNPDEAAGGSERGEKPPSLFFNMPKMLEDEKDRAVGNTDTLEINRLLRRLESAIAKGELGEASVLARDLAQLKVNCSVVRQKSVERNDAGVAGFT